MKKFEIVVPYDIYLAHADEFHSVMLKHCDFWCTNHHHVFGDISKFEHQHIGGWLKSDNTSETISKWFQPFWEQCKPNSIEKIKSRETAYALYIGLHFGQDDKEPLSIDTTEFRCSVCGEFRDVDFSRNWLKNEIEHINVKSEDNRADEYCELIANGLIKLYNVDEYIPTAIQVKYYNKFENAFKVASRRSKGAKSMCDEKTIIWIYGASGSGKTMLATKFFSADKPYYLASDSHPLDDYQGQPVLILDDISDDTMTSKALLKLLDPYNKSSQGARYYNKMVDADLIIVTSTIAPTKWWTDNRKQCENNGSWEQLLRRLTGGVYHIIDTNSMDVTFYNNQGGGYGTVKVNIPDNISKQLKASAEITFQDRANATLKRFNLTISEDDGFIEIPEGEQTELPF